MHAHPAVLRQPALSRFDPEVWELGHRRVQKCVAAPFVGWFLCRSGAKVPVGYWGFLMRRLVLRSIVLAAALSVAGCGVRGSLEAPKDPVSDSTASAESGQGKPAGAAPKPHRDFVLDGLLR